jgi:hypothetical protein
MPEAESTFSTVYIPSKPSDEKQDLRKMETDSKSSPANPDIKLVTIDVKMQIRTLHVVCKHSLAIPNIADYLRHRKLLSFRRQVE